jgi:hypothetical protein
LPRKPAGLAKSRKVVHTGGTQRFSPAAESPLFIGFLASGRSVEESPTLSVSLPKAGYSSGWTRGQTSPVIAAIYHLSSGLPIGKAGLVFSEMPVSLRSSRLHLFGTVLEIRTFGPTYELQRKEVLPVLLDRRGRLNSNSPCRGSNYPASARQFQRRGKFPSSRQKGPPMTGFRSLAGGLYAPDFAHRGAKSPKVSRPTGKISVCG